MINKITKKIIFAAIYLLLALSNLYAQSSIDSVVSQIVRNNKTLMVTSKNIEAEKIGNKTHLSPQNPEIGFNYLWGSPAAMGNRTDVNIKQTFDFPTAYLYKNQISDIKNSQLGFEYQKQLKDIVLKIKLICYDLVHYNALRIELDKRLAHANRIEASYKSKYTIGEANILEYNKAQLNLLNISKEKEMIEIERTVLLNELAGLNGGTPISFNDTAFATTQIPSDFEQWYSVAEQSNPALSWLKSEIEMSRKQKQLSLAMSLPKITTGYVSEKVEGEHFQGIALGLSIPLWENIRQTKYAELKTSAMLDYETDSKLQYYSSLKALHAKAVSLQSSINDYRSKLQILNNTELLQKTLNSGEISLLDYIFELTFYYESVNKMLDLECDLHKTIAHLKQYE